MNQDQIACVGDDKKIRVYNYHTTQKIYEFGSHDDFIRKIVFHSPTNELITCSDDKTVRVWAFDIDKNNYYQKTILSEHNHFVLDLKLDPN